LAAARRPRRCRIPRIDAADPGVTVADQHHARDLFQLANKARREIESPDADRKALKLVADQVHRRPIVVDHVNAHSGPRRKAGERVEVFGGSCHITTCTIVGSELEAPLIAYAYEVPSGDVCAGLEGIQRFIAAS